MGDKDVDAQFADIVAHWDDVESLPDPPDPLVGHPPPPPAPNPTNPPPTRPFVVWRGAEPDPVADEEPDPLELSDDDDEDAHFEPGPTAPLPPQEDLQFWGIVVGLVAGPLLLLWLVLFRPDVSSWWTMAALGLTVGGFVLLVLRQPQSRDEDDPDNGARL
ncbi:hypothetical protein [Nostocoides sp. HKS02]|uniref:hypothetical protein n=1 Tax=Nostocoides sp. HKS02 TaxID=1813880 RepID=UPI0012B46A65|nr:hypothetical protein [Tetrasphaera sp. HKS02]QGN57558.1 hypothetical protein GKE56_06370 [Tetrasphaera sp. HKS02]